MLRLTVLVFTLFLLVAISKVSSLPIVDHSSSFLEKRQFNPEDSQLDPTDTPKTFSSEESDKMEIESLTSGMEKIDQEQDLQVTDESSERDPLSVEPTILTQEEAYQNAIKALPETSNWAQVVDVSNVVPPPTQEQANHNVVNSSPESSDLAQVVDVSDVVQPATLEEAYTLLFGVPYMPHKN
ncbi:hypothetical protein DFH28DRAFT_980943 [Melampsora americana]|nr:hypothetical protein DFH28DRAFT_980943 [Melampsora americana]